MDELRFKVGDKVRVIACRHGHCFDIGHEGKISRKIEHPQQPHYQVDDAWYLSDDELEPINDQEDAK